MVHYQFSVVYMYRKSFVLRNTQSDLKHPSQPTDGLFHAQLHMVIQIWIQIHKHIQWDGIHTFHLDQIQLTFCFLSEPETLGHGLTRALHTDTQTSLWCTLNELTMVQNLVWTSSLRHLVSTVSLCQGLCTSLSYLSLVYTGLHSQDKNFISCERMSYNFKSRKIEVEV